MALFYNLTEDRRVVPATKFNQLDGWGIVGSTYVGPLRVSTVFLGLNQAANEEAPPLVFETMVFDESTPKPERSSCHPTARFEKALYSTWAQAEAGHKRTVEILAPEWGEIRDETEERRAQP